MPTEQPDGNIRDLKDFKDIQRACCKDILLSLVAHKGPADDGKRSEAEWTLHYAGMKREGGSGGRGYRDHTGHYAGGSVKNGSKNGSSFYIYMIWGSFWGV